MLPPVRILTLNGHVSMSFRRIPEGAFRMGSRGESSNEEPVHQVRITEPFYMGTFPVTQAQYAVWTGERTPPGGGAHKNYFEGRPDHPAENVSWDDARTFCAWLNETYGEKLDGFVATLPTEAEWEYACRAGTETEYHPGDGEASLRDAAWFGEDFDTGSTHRVGLVKATNGFGLHDMHGNVWEWCWDAYDGDAYKTRVNGAADPGREDREAFLRGGMSVDSSSTRGNPGRVVRGGSWIITAWGCRSAYRFGWRRGVRTGVLGFRVCLVPGPAFANGYGEAGPVTDGTPGDGARPASAQGFGVAGRDDVAESQGVGADSAMADLRSARFPPRRGGAPRTK